jgi:hypothetical protein
MRQPGPRPLLRLLDRSRHHGIDGFPVRDVVDQTQRSTVGVPCLKSLDCRFRPGRVASGYDGGGTGCHEDRGDPEFDVGVAGGDERDMFRFRKVEIVHVSA